MNYKSPGHYSNMHTQGAIDTHAALTNQNTDFQKNISL